MMEKLAHHDESKRINLSKLISHVEIGRAYVKYYSMLKLQ